MNTKPSAPLNEVQGRTFFEADAPAFSKVVTTGTQASSRHLGRRQAIGLGVWLPLLGFGCRRSSQISSERAREHVPFVARAVQQDLEEVRTGMPKGGEMLREYFAAGKFEDASNARLMLDRVRSKVQDLRVAKSTFFALVDTAGTVIRTDQEHDAMASKNLLPMFPELRTALAGKYTETRGALPEAAAVRGKDAQWVAAEPVLVDGKVAGLYVTGWSFSAYAYRLENQLRSTVRGALKQTEKEPLVYVYVVVGKDVFGAPVSPEVNARVVAEQNLSGKPPSPEPTARELEITGREFGLAFLATPGLGKDVGVVVLRSET